MPGNKHSKTKKSIPAIPITIGLIFFSKKSNPPKPITIPNNIDSKCVIGSTQIAGWGTFLRMRKILIPLNKIKTETSKINFFLSELRTSRSIINGIKI